MADEIDATDKVAALSNRFDAALADVEALKPRLDAAYSRMITRQFENNRHWSNATNKLKAEIATKMAAIDAEILQFAITKQAAGRELVDVFDAWEKDLPSELQAFFKTWKAENEPLLKNERSYQTNLLQSVDKWADDLIFIRRQNDSSLNMLNDDVRNTFTQMGAAWEGFAKEAAQLQSDMKAYCSKVLAECERKQAKIDADRKWLDDSERIFWGIKDKFEGKLFSRKGEEGPSEKDIFAYGFIVGLTPVLLVIFSFWWS